MPGATAGMSEDDLDEYWRSPRGATAYQEALDRHFDCLLHQSSRAECIEKTGEVEVFVMHDFPEEGAKTLITKGLSRFILDPGVRVELAISLKERYSSRWGAQLLLDLATAALMRRTVWDEYTIISDADFSGIGESVSVRHLVFMLGHWLRESEHKIENHYPALILELVPILQTEATLLERDRANFLEIGRSGSIDALDLCRAELPSQIH